MSGCRDTDGIADYWRVYQGDSITGVEDDGRRTWGGMVMLLQSTNNGTAVLVSKSMPVFMVVIWMSSTIDLIYW